MTIEEPWYSAEEVTRLAAQVRRRLGDVGTSNVRIPRVDEYRVALRPRHDSDALRSISLAVDIDVGRTTLGLRIEADPSDPPGSLKVNEVAKGIAVHVLLALSDPAGLAALEKAEVTFRRKVRRDGLPLDLISVRYRPAEIHRPESLLGRTFCVELALLDHTLRPTTTLVTGRTVREVCSELKRLGEFARLRAARHELLRTVGAVLEVDAAAEQAIQAAGRPLGTIVQELLDPRRQDRMDPGPRVELWSDRALHGVSIRVVDGRIVLDVDLGAVWSGQPGVFIFRGALPKTVLISLPGRQLRDVIDHPLLPGDATILDVQENGAGEFSIRTELRRRPVTLEEILPQQGVNLVPDVH